MIVHINQQQFVGFYMLSLDMVLSSFRDLDRFESIGKHWLSGAVFTRACGAGEPWHFGSYIKSSHIEVVRFEF